MDAARLTQVHTLLDRALVAYPGDPYLLPYRGYVAFRQVIGMRMMGDTRQIAPIISAGLADLEKSAAVLPWPEAIALEASLTAGGGTVRARSLVAKAIRLFATDVPGPLQPAWGKEEAQMLQEHRASAGRDTRGLSRSRA